MHSARAIAKSMGAACFVAAVAPVVAFVGFWGVVSASAHALLPLRLRELGGLYLEVAPPTAVASALFAMGLFGWPTVRAWRDLRVGMAALGAACFVAVFGVQFLSSLVLRGHFSGSGLLIAVLAGLAGAMSAALLPRALLPLASEVRQGG